MDERPIIDLAQLERQTMGDQALRDEVLGMFVRQLEDALRDIGAEPQGARDHGALAHQILGTARALGAFPLAQAADCLDRNEDRGALDDFVQHLKEARAEAQRLLEAR